MTTISGHVPRNLALTAAMLSLPLLLASGCSESSKGMGPAPARAGGATGSGPSTGTGGLFGSGPSGSGGSTGSTMPPGNTSDAGTLPPINESGMATVKFCNLIARADGGDLVLTMELGTRKVRLTANSGQCAPVKGQPCASIPAGDIPATMTLDGRNVITGVLRVTPNEPVILLAEYDEAAMRPKVSGASIKPEYKCEDVELTEGPAPDGGAPDGGTRPPPRI